MSGRFLAFIVVVAGVMAGCESRQTSPIATDLLSGSDALQSISPGIVQGDDGSKFREVFGYTDPPPCAGVAAGLHAGPDNTMWLADGCNDVAVKIDMFGNATTYHLNGTPQWIAPGPDRNMWVTLRMPDAVAKVTPDGVVTYYTVPCENNLNSLAEIVAGPDGNMWFTTGGGYFAGIGVGRITTSGVSACFPTARPSTWGITAGPDGNVWFTEPVYPALLGKITPAGVLSEFPDTNYCYHIIAAGDGNLYCLSTQGVVRIYPATAAETVVAPQWDGSNLSASGSGPSAAIYFTGLEQKLVTLHLANDMTTRDKVPHSEELLAAYVAYGPDGNLWYTADGVNGLAYVSVDIFRIITARPTSLTPHVGYKQIVVVSESDYYRKSFTGLSSNTFVATINPAEKTGTFVVGAVGVGSATLTISDQAFNSVTIPVTVTQ